MKFPIFTLLLFFYCNILRNIMTSGTFYNFTINFDALGLDVEKDVRYYLYTRANGENPQQLWVDNAKGLKESAFNSSKATKFMTHGWMNNYQGHNCITVRRAFLAHNDYNVIVVDWGNTAKLPYLIAAGRIKACGAYIARMISFLVKQGGANPDNMTLVGHSLGAHLIGLAGYQAIDKVGHLVGLDPASPGFMFAGPGSGISSSDAKVVEIIHTNANDVGLAKPLGHLDYYPNGGGEEQPGCGEDPKHYCAHARAYYYYAEAIRKPESLVAVKCNNYQEFLSGACDKKDVLPFATASNDKKLGKQGSYFLRTNDEAPFGLGLKGLN